jgi:hypothetical protein
MPGLAPVQPVSTLWGTDRRTKQLIELDDVEHSIEGRTLFSPIRMMIQPGMRVGSGRAKRQRKDDAAPFDSR